MQKGKSYIKDSGDFINKIKELQSIPDGAILVTSDVVALYPNIPYEAGLKALKDVLGNRESKSISTEGFIKWLVSYCKTISLNSMGLLNNRYQGLLLVLNLHQHIPVLLRIS